MRTGIYVVIILLFSIAAGVFLVDFLKQKNPIIEIPAENSCSSDGECDWGITNCCPENAGAKWNCLNADNRQARTCPSSVICPQVISPKPNKTCVCIKGMCETK
ncbi:MAG: hypothetical protein J4452_02675 [Candidatus Aenigmarchaeota archaeon]|nr:hypothetical protein [Candidatus Aenigmarchaeota archaeon]